MANTPKNLNNLENIQRTKGECRENQETMCEMNNVNVNKERKPRNFLAVSWLGH